MGSYAFLDDERPLLPGAPHTPPHPALRRVAYFAIGLWIAVTGPLANAAVLANLGNLAGETGAYLAEVSWLPAIYVAFNACANLLLVKSRAQFGVAKVMRPLLAVYLALAVLQLVEPGLPSSLATRAISGVAAAGQISLCLYYLMQALPKAVRPIALVIGMGASQLATPFARMIPVDLLTSSGGVGLHLIELAIVATTLALTQVLPLPPGQNSRQFEPLDFLTIALFLPAMVLFCGVLNRGRLGWWTDTPWLGEALVAATVLLALALIVEVNRANPLLHLRWLGTFELLRFAGIALLMRLALAEQTYGSVGLLTASGLNDDQLRVLFGLVAGSIALGIAVGVKTMGPTTAGRQILASALSIGIGAWLDSHANSLTRPEQLYLSQALIGFGTSLFVGPALAHGVMQVLKSGPNYFTTLVVVFSITQNVGGLAGSALLGSYQTVATRQHLGVLTERITAGDPMSAARIGASVSRFTPATSDPTARSLQGQSALSNTVLREANTLAFNDVFRFVALLAFGTAALVGINVAVTAAASRRKQQP